MYKTFAQVRLLNNGQLCHPFLNLGQHNSEEMLEELVVSILIEFSNLLFGVQLTNSKDGIHQLFVVQPICVVHHLSQHCFVLVSAEQLFVKVFVSYVTSGC